MSFDEYKEYSVEFLPTNEVLYVDTASGEICPANELEATFDLDF